MDGAAERKIEAARLEAELAEVCGVLNAATGRLVSLIAQVLATESWQGWGIRSASHWVAWKCGVSPARARGLVLMARRLGELPEMKAALEAGELCEDQVAVVCRHTPAAVDAEVATGRPAPGASPPAQAAKSVKAAAAAAAGALTSAP